MGQNGEKRYAAVKDAQTELSGEEYALSMGQRAITNYAAVKDAQIM